MYPTAWFELLRHFGLMKCRVKGDGLSGRHWVGNNSEASRSKGLEVKQNFRQWIQLLVHGISEKKGRSRNRHRTDCTELCLHPRLVCCSQEVSLVISQLNPSVAIAVNNNDVFLENSPFPKRTDPFRAGRTCSRKQGLWKEGPKVLDVRSGCTSMFLLQLSVAHVFSCWLYRVLRHFLWADSDCERLNCDERHGFFPKRK